MNTIICDVALTKVSFNSLTYQSEDKNDAASVLCLRRRIVGSLDPPKRLQLVIGEAEEEEEPPSPAHRVSSRPMPASAHGTISGYNRWQCRCPACRDAQRIYRRKQRAHA
jgi:hypothetical protein